MIKLLVIVLCLALTLPVLALAEGDGRVHITYSFWGNQTEAESVQQALDAYNEMQDKVFVEPMQIPNEQYTETLVNYAIADQLPDCGMVNENSVLISPATASWPMSPICMPVKSCSPWTVLPLRTTGFLSVIPAATKF